MSLRTLTEAVASRENSFILVRTAGAATVGVYHGFALSGDPAPGQELTGLSFGSIAVLAFFAISGCLITDSWLRDPRPRVFLAKRALRLIPGLAVCALLVAFVLGPLVTSLSAREYFGDSGPYAYFLRQVVLVTFNPFLPGVFADNPVADVVNGSLWTIPLDACCYLALLVAGVIGALRHPRVLAALLGVVVLAMLVAAAPDDATGKAPTGIDIFLNGLRPCGAFLAGALLWLWRERLPLHPLFGLAAAGALFLPVSLELHSAIDILAVPYLTVLLGSLRPGRLSVLARPGDVSYGFFIYAFPIQQTLVQLISGIGPGALIAISLPAAWLAGLLSWHLVERPATGLARGLRRPGTCRPPRPSAASSHAPRPVRGRARRRRPSAGA